MIFRLIGQCDFTDSYAYFDIRQNIDCHARLVTFRLMVKIW